MRTNYIEQLKQLNVQVKEMGMLCENAISLLTKSLVKKDDDEFGTIHEIETKIDQKERDIENLCMKLILKQQPVASDLRLVSSALKMVSDMERIGDQAADIAELIPYIQDVQGECISDISDMAVAAIKMVTESVECFIKGDMAKTKEVIEYDDVIDNLFNKVKNDLTELIVSEKQVSEACLDLLMIAKYFERIGDHATNIAEWVYYSITGFRYEYEKIVDIEDRIK